MIAGDPHQGGATWAVLQYVLGLEQLGHEVFVVEPVGELRPETASYFRNVLGTFDLARRSALVAGSGTVSSSQDCLRRAARRADVLLNISGLLRDDSLVERIPVRIYLDLDPAFNQLWHSEGIDVGFEGHTHFASVGRLIGRGSQVASCGIEWIPMFPPVVLGRWPVAERVELDALTTVGNWRGYGSIERGGIRYGQKAHSLRRFMDLPRRVDERFALALAIDAGEEADLAALAANGWELVDPRVVAGTPAAYQAFLQASKAEFGIAKEGYVVSRCGWFGDRSAAYLACGKPVLAQSTGFDEFLPVGAGLFSFAVADDVGVAVDELRRDYARHARAARAIAEEFLDSDRVLTDLLQAAGALTKGRRQSVHDAGEAELAAALGRPIATIRRRPFVARSSAPIAEVDVVFADQSAAVMLLKDLGRNGLTERARRAKPGALHNPVREVEVYRALLAGAELGTPKLYGAVADPSRDQYWLLIERVVGRELYQVGEIEIWEAVMRWLARFHRHFQGRALTPSLLQYDRDFFLSWRDRASSIAGIDAPEGYEEVAELLASLPTTLLHGEFYASNILVVDERICPVDWEMAAIGPAVIDVAAVTSGWEESDQEHLVQAYLEEASAQKERDFARDLDCARVQLALQWLGWSADWSPPPDQNRDWSATLAAARRRLGL